MASSIFIGSSAVTIVDGGDVTEGSINDAAVTTDSPGTISAKLRGLVAILSSVWDSLAGAIRVVFSYPNTGTVTSVAANASNVTLLASNASRKGATLYNEGSTAVFVKCAATASSSSFTKKMLSTEYLEIPAGYTGRIDAIWEGSPTGSMRITEFS